MFLLEGYMALDLSDLRGQFCGKLLRDLGMTVIKVEPPGGDAVRRLGPYAGDEPGLERSLRFAHLNAGKQSLTLDLTRAEGRDLLLRLVEGADVLLESGQPGALDALGLGDAALRARNPHLVITHVSGFGQTGPYRDYLAPDIVSFAMGGLMYISGDAALPPVQAPETQAGYFASVYAALGTLLALWQRGADGPGHSVDVSAQEALSSQEHLIRTAAFDGFSIRRHGSAHEHVAPSNLFPTKDGYVSLFVTRPHWRRLLDLWKDHPAELDDPKWLPNHIRRAAADWIDPLVAEFTTQFTKEECAQLLQDHGIPCLPVNTPRDYAHDVQSQARGVFQPSEHAVLGQYSQVAFPAVVDGTRVPMAPPPLLGQHTHAILTERLGLSDADVALLFEQGVT